MGVLAPPYTNIIKIKNNNVLYMQQIIKYIIENSDIPEKIINKYISLIIDKHGKILTGFCISL